ncbi:MAG: VOC family protein [Bacteroidetes bacterium CHB5]|nr:VOC family protein [Bacteroidetes bacterium CHB5]
MEFKAVPTFGISGYQAAINFYVSFLGFQIDWEHRFGPTEPVYMQISRNGLVLHLSENKRFSQTAIVFIETRNLPEFHKELVAKSMARKLPDIEQTKWQTLQLEITDPFGNVLRFNESIQTEKA